MGDPHVALTKPPFLRSYQTARQVVLLTSTTSQTSSSILPHIRRKTAQSTETFSTTRYHTRDLKDFRRLDETLRTMAEDKTWSNKVPCIRRYQRCSVQRKSDDGNYVPWPSTRTTHRWWGKEILYPFLPTECKYRRDIVHILQILVNDLYGPL